jgi:hypothetical protein
MDHQLRQIKLKDNKNLIVFGNKLNIYIEIFKRKKNKNLRGEKELNCVMGVNDFSLEKNLFVSE